MVQIVFKGIEKSGFAENKAKGIYEEVLSRFPKLHRSRVVVTLSMENSPFQPGPDLFKAQLRCQAGSFDGLIFERSSNTLYGALSILAEDLPNRLSRFDDKLKSRKRRHAREKLRILNKTIEDADLDKIS